jgi:hypothetical protein
MNIGDKVGGGVRLRMDGECRGVMIERFANGHVVNLKPFDGDDESEFKHLIGGKLYTDDDNENLGDMGDIYYDNIGSSRGGKSIVVSSWLLASFLSPHEIFVCYLSSTAHPGFIISFIFGRLVHGRGV